MAIKKEIILDLNTGDSGKGLDELKKSFNELNVETPLLETNLKDVEKILTSLAGKADAATAIRKMYPNVEDLQKEIAKLDDLSETIAAGFSAATAAATLLGQQNDILEDSLTRLHDSFASLQSEEGVDGFMKTISTTVEELRNMYVATDFFNDIVKANPAESISNIVKSIVDAYSSYNEAAKIQVKEEQTLYERRTETMQQTIQKQLDLLKKGEFQKLGIMEDYVRKQEQEGKKDQLTNEKKLQYMKEYYAALQESQSTHLEQLNLQLKETDKKDKEQRILIKEQIKEETQLQKEENALFKQEYLLFLYELLEEETLIGLERMKIEKQVQSTLTDTFKVGTKNREKAQENAEKSQKSFFNRFIGGVNNTHDTVKKFLKDTEDFAKGMDFMMKQYEETFAGHTVANKAVAIAQASIDAYTSAQKAFATVPYPGNYVAMGAVLQTAIKNVKKIVNTPVEGASDSTSAPVSATTETAPTLKTELPNTDLDEMYNLPIEKSVNMLASSEDQSLNNSTKVYVVETDISETISKVSVKEAEATY